VGRDLNLGLDRDRDLSLNRDRDVNRDLDVNLDLDVNRDLDVEVDLDRDRSASADPGDVTTAPPPWDPAVLAGIPSDPPVPIDASRALPPRRLVRGAQRLTHLLGRRLLVGITVQNADGAVISRDQFCGQVLEVVDGVVVVDREGTPTVLPADEAAYEAAAPGTYRLADTGEEVVDPDYVTTWTLLERPAGNPPPGP
jgi:hypothetical protein